MKKAIETLISEADQKMGGHAGLHNFQLMCFSVKAEPSTLLSLEIVVDDRTYNIEDVAKVSITREDQMVLIPLRLAYTFPICKAIKKSHPEYKIEQKLPEIEGIEEGKAPTLIYCTMPPVDEERRENGLQLVDTLSDSVNTKLDIVNTAYTARLASVIRDLSDEEKELAKEALKAKYDSYKELSQGYSDKKRAEIETAYRNYLDGQQQKAAEDKERLAAMGEEAGRSLRMDSSDF